MGTPAGFVPTKECFKRSRWFGKRHETDAITKLGEPTIRAACTPQTELDRHFYAFSASFSSIWPFFPRFLLYPQQSVPTLRYTRRHLQSAVPWISENRLLFAGRVYRNVCKTTQCNDVIRIKSMHHVGRSSVYF